MSLSPWFEKRNGNEIFASCIIMNQIPAGRRFPIKEKIPEFENLVRADPYFHRSDPCQMLLGIETWSEIVQGAIVTSERGLIAQQTKFGYTIYGSIESSELFDTSASNASVVVDPDSICVMDDLIKRFWELSDIENESELTHDEIKAVEYFHATISRNEKGRFITRIPFTEDRELGDSRSIALNRFQSLERRLNRDRILKEKYHE